MGRSGSRSKRDGRSLWAEAATTRLRTKGWHPIKAAPLMESKAVFSDEQVGLPWGLVSQVALVLAHGGIMDFFLRIGSPAAAANSHSAKAS